MRGGDAAKVVEIIAKKLGEIENEVEALHSQTHMSAEDEAEDLSTDEEESDVGSILHSSYTPSKAPRIPQPEQDAKETRVPEWTQVRHDKLLVDAQSALQTLTHAQEELQKRYCELLEINDKHAADSEEHELELLKLRGENEALRSDLGFDHAELLFLELQMRSLEVDYSEDITSGDILLKTERLQSVLDNWREDWRDVEARFKKRRSKYDVETPDQRCLPGQQAHDPEEWQIEVCKRGDRRVGSLTLRRVSAEVEPAEDACPEEEEEEYFPTTTNEPASSLETAPEATKTELKSYTSHSTQTDFPFFCPDPALDSGDCAITTSASTPSGDDGSRDMVTRTAESEKTGVKKRTAMQELWDNLADLAGLGGDDGDDEEDKEDRS
jgi:hypothetical protein